MQMYAFAETICEVAHYYEETLPGWRCKVFHLAFIDNPLVTRANPPVKIFQDALINNMNRDPDA